MELMEIIIYLVIGIFVGWGGLYWYSRKNLVDMEDVFMFVIAIPFLWPLAFLFLAVVNGLVFIRDWLNDH